MSKDLILQLISLIDLTTLDNKDNEESVMKLVNKANLGISGTHPAAICVHAHFAELVKNNTDIPVAVVGGYFPSGQTTSSIKKAELEILGKSVADEIDIVINRGELAAENNELISREIKEARSVTAGKHLKVILESGELTPDQIVTASKLAISAGADFIKTSTGKIPVGATPEAAEIMCTEINNWFIQTGKKVGFKPSGGIRTFEEAMVYYNIVHDILGEEWLTPELFRIGASSLYDNLVRELENL